MAINNPYSLNTELVKENAKQKVEELKRKGFGIETIRKNLLSGIASCDRQIKRNSFNLEAIAKKEWLTHQLNATY